MLRSFLHDHLLLLTLNILLYLHDSCNLWKNKFTKYLPSKILRISKINRFLHFWRKNRACWTLKLGISATGKIFFSPDYFAANDKSLARGANYTRLLMFGEQQEHWAWHIISKFQSVVSSFVWRHPIRNKISLSCGNAVKQGTLPSTFRAIWVALAARW